MATAVSLRGSVPRKMLAMPLLETKFIDPIVVQVIARLE